jgi:probable rRNA maturation factor
MLDVEVITDSQLSPEVSNALAALLAHSAANEDATSRNGATVALRLCDDAEIAALHETFLGDPTPTDVMTFPYESREDEGYLGDIVVSLDTAREQARAAGHSELREVAFLALHGLLHLLGYDDDRPEERDRMLERQSTLLMAFEREQSPPW